MKTNGKIWLATITAVGVSVFSAVAVPVTPLNVTLTLPLTSSSTMVNDIQANGISMFGPGLSPAAQLNWLQQNVNRYNLNFLQDLPMPPDQTGTGESTSAVTVMPGDYLVLHYGSGPGGSPSGGILGLFFDTSGTYDVPQMGSGPNGFGGISFVTLFTSTPQTVPDGGSSALLLGCGLLSFGLMGQTRFFKRA